MGNEYVMGVDFGTDSVRCIIVDARGGETLASSVSYYPRWRQGLYSDPASDRYRQHPLDYIESFTDAVRDTLARVPREVAAGIRGIGFDTTGSTPVITDGDGTPLALLPGFEEEPDAMFMLWKDHTSLAEAAQINELAHGWTTDYTRYSGGTYSAEWAWAKVLHVLRTNPKVAAKAYSWVEHCDWMTGLLTGGTKPETICRSRCAAGHKAMWHAEWDGLPSAEFLERLDPRLAAMRPRLYRDTFTCDVKAGVITREWADKLGLPEGTAVSVGAIDAHMGAVGAGIKPGTLVRIMGTSTCDIIVAPYEETERQIKGICGQVDGSVVPGAVGLEAGQSAFGDIYAWFGSILAWPLNSLIPEGPERRAALEKILPALTAEAEKIPVSTGDPVALDWLNGRRTPYADQSLTGMIAGLTLGTTAPAIFKTLVEATAYGSKAIADHFHSEGVCISEVVAIGGISQKSPFVMQILTDVMDMPIKVSASDQACALGSAMFASVAAGLHPDVASAQEAMSAGYVSEYKPDASRAEVYKKLYEKYLAYSRCNQSLLT